MSRTAIPALQDSWRYSAGWRDEDFYRIKLRMDRAEGKDRFWYLLTHPKEAWRNFLLWWKFRDLVKKWDKPVFRPRPKTFFKWKKKKIPPPEIVEVKEDYNSFRRKLEEVKEEPKKTIDEKDKKE